MKNTLFIVIILLHYGIISIYTSYVIKISEKIEAVIFCCHILLITISTNITKKPRLDSAETETPLKSDTKVSHDSTIVTPTTDESSTSSERGLRSENRVLKNEKIVLQNELNTANRQLTEVNRQLAEANRQLGEATINVP